MHGSAQTAVSTIANISVTPQPPCVKLMAAFMYKELLIIYEYLHAFNFVSHPWGGEKLRGDVLNSFPCRAVKPVMLANLEGAVYMICVNNRKYDELTTFLV